MSGGVTLVVVIAAGILGVSVLYVIYHLTSLSHSLTGVRAEARREMTAKEEQLREQIRSSLDQRSEWAREEFAEALAAAKAEMAEENAAFRRDMARAVEHLAEEVAALRARTDAPAPAVLSAVAGEDRDGKGRPQGTA